MTRNENASGRTRRSVLQGLGGATALGLFASVGSAGGDPNTYTIMQDGQCFEVTPLSGSQTVEMLYDLQIPERYGGDNGSTDRGGPYFRSEGTRDLQRENTTITFLYEGARGLHLVVVHDTPDGTAGSASWTVRDVPTGASWLVADDLYTGPDSDLQASTNYDNWDTAGTTNQIDWTWNGRATDGGVLGSLGEFTSFEIVPAYNERAALYNEYYEGGEITSWEFLSGSRSNPERISLDLNNTLTISRRDCPDGDRPDYDDPDDGDDDDGDNGDDDPDDGDDDEEEVDEERPDYEKSEDERRREYEDGQRGDDDDDEDDDDDDEDDDDDDEDDDGNKGRDDEDKGEDGNRGRDDEDKGDDGNRGRDDEDDDNGRGNSRNGRPNYGSSESERRREYEQKMRGLWKKHDED